jgi:ABC-type sulfate transport system permease component
MRGLLVALFFVTVIYGNWSVQKTFGSLEKELTVRAHSRS